MRKPKRTKRYRLMRNNYQVWEKDRKRFLWIRSVYQMHPPNFYSKQFFSPSDRNLPTGRGLYMKCPKKHVKKYLSKCTCHHMIKSSFTCFLGHFISPSVLKSPTTWVPRDRPLYTGAEMSLKTYKGRRNPNYQKRIEWFIIGKARYGFIQSAAE